MKIIDLRRQTEVRQTIDHETSDLGLKRSECTQDEGPHKGTGFGCWAEKKV